MIETVNKEQCTGCTACVSICPKGCICMEKDRDGFFYPKVNSHQCIHCGLCEKTCPVLISNNDTTNNTYEYAFQISNLELRKQSTAGGFVMCLASLMIDKMNAVVYAVGYDENAVVSHLRIENKDALLNALGSKYVQSNLTGIFSAVKKDILNNRMVLFIGTPCQAHGLVHYLRGDRKNLVIIDLLCLGVSSPGLFEKYLSYLGSKYTSKVNNVQFRNKAFGYSTPNVRVVFDDGNFIEQCYDSKVHANLFFKRHYNVRPSCYACEFRERPRVSDFTIGDFTDIWKYSAEMNDDTGVTHLWVHTDTGLSLLGLLGDESQYLSIRGKISNIVGGARCQISRPAERDEFFSDSNSMTYFEFVRKWEPSRWKDTLISFCRKVLIRLPFHKKIFIAFRQIKLIRYRRSAVKI